MNKKQWLLSFLMIWCLKGFSQADKSQYTGNYKFPEGSVVTLISIVLEDSTLVMNSSAGASPLSYVKDDEFTIINFNGTAVFKRNAEAKINGVHIEAMGYVLDGTKEASGGWAWVEKRPFLYIHKDIHQR